LYYGARLLKKLNLRRNYNGVNKDVIYIDVEDDITAIIGKIKACNEKIIALVPPKHVGILQSAVNLRLLDRIANTNRKKLVIITNNPALMALTAVAGIPVAKNLQSKPELAEVAALSIDDDDDIIDGSSLSVGELQKTADSQSDSSGPSDEDINTIDIDDKVASVSALQSAIKKSSPSKNKSGVKVPNFSSFRKKLFLGIGALVVLIIFLVWANVFAPAAKVIITAKTTPEAVSATVNLGGNAASDVAKGTIQSVTKQLKKDVSVDFAATGSKNVGAKATGTVKFSQQSLTATPVPVGTQLSTSGGLVFVTDSAVTIPKSDTTPPVCFPTACPGTATVSVTATEGGASYNGASGGLNGSPSGVSTQFTSASNGGTDKVATVVSADDIQKATAQLGQQSSDTAKSALKAQFVNGEVVIDDSFSVAAASPVSAPAVDAESTDGKAKLTASTTYTVIAIAKSDLELFLKANLNKQLVGNTSQRVYDDGISKVQLSGFTKTGDQQTVNIISSGQIGPNIDEAKIKDQIKGKIFGDVQSSLSAIPGVDNVDVKFSYFWVRTVPNDINKISVEFVLENG
jgi:hypothetical protein